MVRAEFHIYILFFFLLFNKYLAHSSSPSCLIADCEVISPTSVWYSRSFVQLVIYPSFSSLFDHETDVVIKHGSDGCFKDFVFRLDSQIFIAPYGTVKTCSWSCRFDGLSPSVPISPYPYIYIPRYLNFISCCAIFPSISGLNLGGVLDVVMVLVFCHWYVHFELLWCCVEFVQ